eukprot:7111911-Pyramimonas_sp.AAC.1
MAMWPSEGSCVLSRVLSNPGDCTGPREGLVADRSRPGHHGATKRMKSVLPMGPRNTALGAGTACEFRHWDLRWSFL